MGCSRDVAGTDVAVILDGDPAPGAGGTFSAAFSPVLVDSGSVFALGSVSGGTAASGIFRSTSGVVTDVVLEGAALPGTGGGTLDAILFYSANASDDVAFAANVAGGTSSVGVFLQSGPTLTAIAVQGDAAPGTGGGSFDSFLMSSIGGSGAIAFRSNVSGGTTGTGIFLASPLPPSVPGIPPQAFFLAALALLGIGAAASRSRKLASARLPA